MIWKRAQATERYSGDQPVPELLPDPHGAVQDGVIHAGDLPDVLYYIVSGSVEVMIEDEEGNEMVLAYLNKGQFFGEMGLFYEQPQRSAWVRTRRSASSPK